MITIHLGGFQDAEGNVLAGGSLVLQLTSDAQESVTNPNGQVVGGIPIAIALDASGNAVSTNIWSNAELNPPGSGYKVTAYNSTGALAWLQPQIWVFSQTTGTTVDLGTIIPVTASGQTFAVSGTVLLSPNSDQIITLHNLSIANGSLTATNGDSGRLPLSITGRAVVGNANVQLGTGTGTVYGVIGAVRGGGDALGDRAYAGWFFATAQHNTTTEVGIHSEVADIGGTPAEFYAGGIQVAQIGSHGSSIGVSGSSGFRDTLQLLSDAPRLYFGTGAAHTNFKIADQDTTSNALEISVGAGGQSDPTADTYTPVVLVSSSGVRIGGSAPAVTLGIGGDGFVKSLGTSSQYESNDGTVRGVSGVQAFTTGSYNVGTVTAHPLRFYVQAVQIASITSTGLAINGSTSGSTTVKAAATASGTLTLPSATDTLVGLSTTDTLSNKSISTGGNTITGILVESSFNTGIGLTAGNPTAVAANTTTQLGASGLTLPSKGGPFRLLISYGVDFAMSTTAGTVNCWISDGTNTLAPSQMAYAASTTGGQNASGVTATTYVNSASPNFTLFCRSTQAGTANNAATNTGSPNAYLTVSVISAI